MTLAPLAQGNRDSGEQKRGSDADHDLDGGQGPPRDTRSRDDVEHEADRRNHVEKPVSKDRAENRGPGVAVPRNVTRQHAHAGHLADPSGKDGVAQQAHAERGEDVPMARMRGWQRLVEDDVPGDRPYLHGEQVHPDGGRDPLPAHFGESPPDDVEIRSAPDQDADDDRAGCEQKADPAAAGVQDSLCHAPAAPASAGTRQRAVDLDETGCDARPRVTLLGHLPSVDSHRDAARLVLEQLDDRARQRLGVAGGHHDPHPAVGHVAVAGDVRGNDGRGRRRGLGQHHAEGLRADRRGREQLGAARAPRHGPRRSQRRGYRSRPRALPAGAARSAPPAGRRP